MSCSRACGTCARGACHASGVFLPSSVCFFASHICLSNNLSKAPASNICRDRLRFVSRLGVDAEARALHRLQVRLYCSVRTSVFGLTPTHTELVAVFLLPVFCSRRSTFFGLHLL